MIKLDEKPMDADEVTSISKADTIEAIGDFWDTHDFTDDDSDSPDVELRVPARSPMDLPAEALAWLGRAVGAASHPLIIVPMGGATSSSLFHIERTGAPAAERYVLRVLDNREWLAAEPDLASHEAAALDEAQRAGLPAPRLVAYADDDVGFGAPVVLMSFLDGSVDLRPADFQVWLRTLAAQLAAIHRCPADGFPWRFRSWVNRAALVTPAWSAVPRLWERAIEFWLRTKPESRAVFIHRDYHPTNVLWHEGAVSGVVDWINASAGRRTSTWRTAAPTWRGCMAPPRPTSS